MLKHFFQRDTSFANLMQDRIYNILLIARKYEAFMLEDDGRIDENIFNEYVSLNLRYPPRFTEVVNVEDATEELRLRNYDLVIVMPGADNFDVFDEAKLIKSEFPKIPIVVLTPFFREVALKLAKEDLSAIDYVFCWLGNADLLLAIIKLLEDKLNVEADMKSVGVQTILVVEDSIRFYSSMLPQLYKVILKQSQKFSTEALNEHEKMLRMRGRPKIQLARSYEEAIEIYDKFRHNILGIISDVSFMRENIKDKKAGIHFCEYIRKKDPFIPIIMQSSESENILEARKLNAIFLDKNSENLPVELRKSVIRNFGFGDFEFIDPESDEVIATVSNLNEFQRTMFEIPQKSLLYHASRNHFSRWFFSRAMFPLGAYTQQHRFSNYDTFEEGRQALFNAIVEYRKMKNRGVVAIFQKERFDKYSHFARIGNGSLGGKGRGLAFIDSILKRRSEIDGFEPVSIRIPKTLILCSDLFDEFMEHNHLYPLAMSNKSDEEILTEFTNSELPDSLHDDCMQFIDVVDSPVAIRSSSTLEDSHYQPFAGVYSTYMIPKSEKENMLIMLSVAIKSVYASVFFKESKAYLQATQNMVDEEKMSIILQEVVGSDHDNRYYPSFSGVARSLNFYPILHEKPEEGIAQVALGLGKYIVDGGLSLRFSPSHPNHVLQLSSMEMTLRETQKQFYALDTSQIEKILSVDDGFNLLHLPIKQAEEDGTLQHIASTFDLQNQQLLDGLYDGGRKIITFSHILNHNKFPLADILKQVLRIGEEEMGCPVEIEFAVNLHEPDMPKGVFYWLQIRPIVNITKLIDEDLSQADAAECLIYSSNAMGHAMISDVQDIIYVKSKSFDAANNPKIAREIEELNKELVANERGFVLVGPGRWGSADPWLGIPVKWSDISGARVIVETVLEHYRIEPSQGTHFFQNLTSFGVGYFTINSFLLSGSLDEQFLDEQPAIYESETVRHVRFSTPFTIKIDGKKGIGLVRKPNDK
ncbi:MAG: PEP/pyruvate-binding domain-containing protein [Bacteroidales bacterium]|nr:PEP/pyruvate-binding domain-containing protein [Bacteroidales bacterium]